VLLLTSSLKIGISSSQQLTSYF